MEKEKSISPFMWSGGGRPANQNGAGILLTTETRSGRSMAKLTAVTTDRPGSLTQSSAFPDDIDTAQAGATLNAARIVSSLAQRPDSTSLRQVKVTLQRAARDAPQQAQRPQRLADFDVRLDMRVAGARTAPPRPQRDLPGRNRLAEQRRFGRRVRRAGEAGGPDAAEAAARHKPRRFDQLILGHAGQIVPSFDLAAGGDDPAMVPAAQQPLAGAFGRQRLDLGQRRRVRQLDGRQQQEKGHAIELYPRRDIPSPRRTPGPRGDSP